MLSGLNGTDAPETTQYVHHLGIISLPTATNQTEELETNGDSESIRQIRTIADQPEFQQNGGSNQKIQNDEPSGEEPMNIAAQRDRKIIVKSDILTCQIEPKSYKGDSSEKYY